MLEDRRIQPVTVLTSSVAAAEVPLDPTEEVLTQAGQILNQVAGLIQDRRVASNGIAAVEAATAVFDVTEQIGKLAALRDQNIPTEEEFSSKKAELLARL